MSGRRGLAVRHWGDPDRDDGAQQPNLRYIVEDGHAVDGYYNPFRRYGYLSAANATFATVDQVSAFTAIPSSVIYDDVNDDIIVADKGRYFKVLADGLDDLQFYSGSSIGDLGATGSPRIFDLDFYTINSVRRLFVVHEKSDNIEIAHFPVPYDVGAGVTNFFTVAGGGGSIGIARTLFMRVADNGFAYVFSDSNVHKIDGTASGGANGTITSNVLQFPTTFTIADAIDYRGFMFMGIIQAPVIPTSVASAVKVYNLPCGVYVWDRQSTVSGTTDFIPLYGARAIVKLYTTWTGILRAMTVNAEGVLEIREYDGNSFNVICEVGRGAHPNEHDSFTTSNGLAMWLGANGTIYAHGSIAPGEKEGLYKIGALPETGTGGFVFLSGGNDFTSSTGYKRFRSGLYLGYQAVDLSMKVKQWDMYGTGASGVTALCLAGNVYTPPFFLPQMSTVRHIDIYMVPGSGTGSTVAGQFGIYFNQSATAWATKNVTRDQHARGYIRIEVNKPYVNSVQIKTIFPSTIGLAGNFEIAPSFAVVEYVPTETRG